ncbi:MAG: hypothetical protein A2381_13010 [Bdellovibrionales bacterium RIFOXYB1_FULL_37_110]|nr:MAG: hypothetical protein A2181_02335 [Bdellovibrionales bacterium RIFOXYA1_FULL_38_20]OFZ51627.1 MAG: hypothetical protein A2417_12670 [Bdellovibrionales bacterium RIFOXYC1_FULL_37_79]OFZ60454.1 MAG: hypothetical protein A2381_13010 [Bdellovibrionales bacterium RIFOXYB1_FULL_37_110]OFZ65027.1 MAG: hypothetical protein A2577_09275 [Bdellovibrionales bacterium RIFOXYD1_FULL_36_51]OFZ71918.1 MAG: hypothetical protein A2451_07985 [Bdellovibrionales bacterium RIFOXYC2_FULL_39_8]
MNENMEVKIQGDLLHSQKVKAIKKCPRCQSIYLTDKECEACGFQLNFNFIGEPFGHLSFYESQEIFYRMGTLRRLAYFILDKKYSRYLKYELAIKRRLDNLLTYFFDHIDPVERNRKFFYLELTHLVAEFEKLGLKKYLSYRIKDKVMSSDKETIAGNSVYVSKITSWIDHREDQKTKLEQLLTLKIFGTIRVGYIMLIMLFNLILITVGLKMFSYFVVLP